MSPPAQSTCAQVSRNASDCERQPVIAMKRTVSVSSRPKCRHTASSWSGSKKPTRTLSSRIVVTGGVTAMRPWRTARR
jgi:hypothetical protein